MEDLTVTETRRRTRSKPADRRAQILNEALRLIGERGYRGFTISELAQRCELAQSGLLHYFDSKEKILIALLQDRDRRESEIATSIMGLTQQDLEHTKLTLPEVILHFHAAVVHESTQPELLRLYAVLRAEAMNKSHPAHEYFQLREAEVLAAMARYVAPHVRDPESTARQLLALVQGLELQWVQSDQAFDLVTECDLAAEALLRPY